MTPPWRWNRSRTTLIALIVLSFLIVGFTAVASATGFHDGLVPAFSLNAACDLLGAAIFLFLIEPIVRSAVIGIRAHPHFNAPRFRQRVAAARHTVRILDTSSQVVLADPERQFRFREALRKAVDNGAQVMILLMSPASDASRARAQQLRGRYPNLDLDLNITQTIKQLREYKQALGDHDGSRLQVRLYTTPPPFILYGADDVLIYTTVPNDAIADDSPQVEVNDQSLLGGYLIDGFDDLWETSRELDGLLEVRLADRPDDVPMLMRAFDYEGATFVTAHRLDRLLERMDEHLFLLGSDREALYKALPVTMGTPLHEHLLEELKHRHQTQATDRPDRTFYRMAKRSTDHRSDDRTEAYRSLPIRLLADLIGHADRDIRILDTSSTLLLPGHDEHSPHGNVLSALNIALGRGAHLRTLLMEPGSDSCRARSEEIGRPDLEEEIRANLAWLADLAARDGLRDSVQVRLYDRPPSISVYQVDDFVISGFMPYGARSSITPHFGSAIGHGPLAPYTINQFDQLWDAGPTGRIRTLSFEELQEFGT